MVHNRLNEREANPNKHINFISALAMPGVPAPYSEEDARQILRALAAQVRPVMKDHGFEINSFEEYEYNRVFAGRNWNNGDTVEIVLRNVDGTFASSQWLVGVLCHELAHIKHMNHGPAFQRLNMQLRSEVLTLQSKGYFGDGYWSSGNRLIDSARIGGEGLRDRDLPEYICGGAFEQSRPQNLTRPRQRRSGRKRAGTRVSKGKFKGEGHALTESTNSDAKGFGFRKQANSKRAREERALAAERRLLALQDSQKKEATKITNLDSDSETDDDVDDVLFIDLTQSSETDDNRRRLLRENAKDDELEQMRSSMVEFFKRGTEDKKALTESRKGKMRETDVTVIDLDEFDGGSHAPNGSSTLSGSVIERPSKRSKLGPAPQEMKRRSKSSTMKQIAMDEVTYRKRESLGLTESNKLGGTPSSILGESPRTETVGNNVAGNWSCLVCTLQNDAQHLACSVCRTERGRSIWKG